jgi:hypothetical protein
MNCVLRGRPGEAFSFLIKLFVVNYSERAKNNQSDLRHKIFIFAHWSVLEVAAFWHRYF